MGTLPDADGPAGTEHFLICLVAPNGRPARAHPRRSARLRRTRHSNTGECRWIDLGSPVAVPAADEQTVVGEGEVHPYFLGLCADVALAAQRHGDQLDPAAMSAR